VAKAGFLLRDLRCFAGHPQLIPGCSRCLDVSRFTITASGAAANDAFSLLFRSPDGVIAELESAPSAYTHGQRKKRKRLIETAKVRGYVGMAPPRILVTCQEFFDGNDDEGSIGCNLNDLKFINTETDSLRKFIFTTNLHFHGTKTVILVIL